MPARADNTVAWRAPERDLSRVSGDVEEVGEFLSEAELLAQLDVRDNALGKWEKVVEESAESWRTTGQGSRVLTCPTTEDARKVVAGLVQAVNGGKYNVKLYRRGRDVLILFRGNRA